MKKEYTVKSMERVLACCMDVSDAADGVGSAEAVLAALTDFSKEDVLRYLGILESRELIEVQWADNEIQYFGIRSAAYDYWIKRADARASYWKNWRWNIAAAFATAVVSSLLGAFLARVSQVIWP
jgi:hypothetical protein